MNKANPKYIGNLSDTSPFYNTNIVTEVNDPRIISSNKLASVAMEQARSKGFPDSNLEVSFCHSEEFSFA